jgi:methionyl-tRNA formyltransferase
MNVLFVTQDDPVYIPYFFRSFFPRRPEGRYWILVLPRSVPGKNYFRALINVAKVYGPGFVLHQAVRAIASKWLGAILAKNLTSIAAAYGAILWRAPSINDPLLIAKLRGLNLDIIFSVAASQVFKGLLLTLPRIGCLNIHSSLLPKYRGLFPCFWVLKNGESSTGVSIHEMNERIDDGVIVTQRKIDILPSDTMHSLMLRCKILGGELAAQAIVDYTSMRFIPRSNDNSVATYFSWPTREDVKVFRTRRSFG